MSNMETFTDDQMSRMMEKVASMRSLDCCSNPSKSPAREIFLMPVAPINESEPTAHVELFAIVCESCGLVDHYNVEYVDPQKSR